MSLLRNAINCYVYCTVSIHPFWLQSITGWAKKTGPFLNVDNFAMVSGRKAYDMSKVYKICLGRSTELA